ncbi:MAG: twin-arginine translocase TatA/TatE family subunit [Elusimicrobia bacterium]|nr:twin-arginine translocase TatA/TatE family subunit [Elusimicrobiota bacterium]
MSWPELVLIGAVALILFGPKRLPELAKSVGKALKAFKEGLKEATTEDKEDKN